MLANKMKALRRFCTQVNSSYYVTTPIFYVNAAPHIGHLYSAVVADAMCRYQSLRKPDGATRLCTGTDENGSKIQLAAAALNVPVGKHCDDISRQYRFVFQEANIAYTDFVRTLQQRHKQAVTHFWQTLQARGHIYSDKYSGWYCTLDETFLTAKQLTLDAATGIRYSAESGHTVEWTEETNYMFRMSALQADVLEWLRQGNRVRPAKFEKVLLDMLSEPLPDLSISRPISRVSWAIPVPDDNTQTVYVWFDALTNYLTSAGYPNEKFQMHWPPKVQVIGKDILKFHGIYWPALLIGAGLEPPQQLYVHSHWTVDGQKMSKSKHNVVDVLEAASVFTMEGVRYFLLREGVSQNDGNYSSVKALRILNAELADTLGNLLSRACAKPLNPQQIYPRLHEEHLRDLLQLDAAKLLQDAIRQLEGSCAKHFNDNKFHLVVDTVMATLHAGNNFFEATRPWEFKSGGNVSVNSLVSHLTTNSASPALSQEETDAKNADNVKRLETIIAMTMDTLRVCAIALQPIVPQISNRLLGKLSVPQTERLWGNLSNSFATETIEVATKRESKPLAGTNAVLYRRITMKEEELEQKFGPKKQQAAKEKQKEPAKSKKMSQ